MLRYIEMDGETQDIQTLRVKARLQNAEKLTGNVGAIVENITSLTETTPGILKETLKAKMFTAYTVVKKNFMRTNIEKEGFECLGWYQGNTRVVTFFSADAENKVFELRYEELEKPLELPSDATMLFKNIKKDYQFY